MKAEANNLTSPLLAWQCNSLKLIQIFGNDNKILFLKNVLVKHYFIPQFLILGWAFEGVEGVFVWVFLTNHI